MVCETLCGLHRMTLTLNRIALHRVCLCVCVGPLSGRTEFPTKEQIGGDTQNDKDTDKRNNVECEAGVQHVQFLECGDGRLEMAVRLVALEFLALERVGGQCGALEAVSDVRQVGDPAQVNGNGVKRDEETAEQEERHGHDGCEEHTVLDIHGGTNNKTDGLGDERDEQTGAQEHRVAIQLHRL